jgi:peptide chain release factor 3
VRQLEEEGLMQVVFPIHGARYPILGVVGALQFDIIEARMREEYGVACRVEKLSYVAARWVQADSNARLTLPNNVLSTTDRPGRRVLLFPSEWDLQFCERENPNVQFLAMA